MRVETRTQTTNIRDSLRKAVIFHHVLDCERLDTDRLVFTDQPCREFVQEVTASIGYSGMDSCDLLSAFSLFLRTFFLPGVSSLRLRKLLLILGEEFGVANRLASREDHEVFQAQVSANGLFTWLKLLDVFFDQDEQSSDLQQSLVTVMVFGLLPLRQWARPHDGKRFSHFGKRQMTTAPLKSGVSIGCRLPVALLFKGGILASSRKEIAECSLKMPQVCCKGTEETFESQCVSSCFFSCVRAALKSV